MKLIVGLGNPGRAYNGTRHNVGFDAVDLLARRHRIHVKARRGKALIGEGNIGEERVILAKPFTYMNLSGQAVGDLLRRYKLTASDVIVVCDDVNLEIGRLRIRSRGSAGGHKGLKSIIHTLGTEEYIRVRIGVGSPHSTRNMVDHVLGRFHKSECRIVSESIERAVDAVETIVTVGVEQAMNTFNSSMPAK